MLIYIAASTAFAQILPLSVLQDLTNSNIKRRILYDAIQAAAVIPFATTYFRSADFRKTETPSKWIPWGLIGVCAILVTIILPERVYAFWFYLIIVGCGEEFVFRGYLEMSRNVQSGNTQNLKSMVIQRSFPKWSVAERRKTAAASDQAAVCACAHSRYFAGGSPSGLRV